MNSSSILGLGNERGHGSTGEQMLCQVGPCVEVETSGHVGVSKRCGRWSKSKEGVPRPLTIIHRNADVYMTYKIYLVSRSTQMRSAQTLVNYIESQSRQPFSYSKIHVLLKRDAAVYPVFFVFSHISSKNLQIQQKFLQSSPPSCPFSVST